VTLAVDLEPAPFEALSQVLRYPDAGFEAAVAACGEAVAARSVAVAADVAAFAAAVAGRPTSAMEELYAQTFDFNPKCTLEIGWHLFGEEYERGELLVRLRGMLREHGIPEAGELPDHLGYVLVLLPRLGRDAAERLVSACVTPALDAILAGLAGQENPYEHLVRATRRLLAGAEAPSDGTTAGDAAAASPPRPSSAPRGAGVGIERGKP